MDVKWAVTFPKGEHGGQATRGRVPFFCHDITERSVRVPLAEEKTAHPSGVLGVFSLTVIVKDGKALENARAVYGSLFGASEDVDDVVKYRTARVVPVSELKSTGGAQINLRVNREGEENEDLNERGFWYGDVILAAKAGEGKDKGKMERIDDGGAGMRGLWVAYV